MQTPSTQPPFPTQLLSPKQAQEKLQRQLKLVKLDKDLQQIVQSHKKQHNECKQYMTRLNQIQSIYQKENTQLKQQIKTITMQYQQLAQLYQITKNELERSLSSFQCLEIRYKSQEKEINRLRQLIKNQENLFDDYRSNLDEEFVLEKQLMRSTFNENKIKMQKEFSITVIKLECQYNDKLKRMKNKRKVVEFQEEVQQFKKYCNNYKENVMKKSQSTFQKPNSQYSTNDRENKQQTPLFIP